MSAARDVWEMSRAILGDQDGYVAVIRVYLDESGIHEGSPVVTVAAYLARPKDWMRFTSEWKRAIKPAKCYHATDAAACQGEFKGWTPDQVIELPKRALPIIPRYTEMGVAIGIQMQDFEVALKGRPTLRKQLGSPYGACLHWVMATILKHKAENDNREQIAFFHETNHYRGEALETFAHMEEIYNPQGARMTFAFGSKEKYVPLQAADILAFEANKRVRRSDTPNRRALDALAPHSGRLEVKVYDRRNLPWLVERLEGVVGLGR